MTTTTTKMRRITATTTAKQQPQRNKMYHIKSLIISLLSVILISRPLSVWTAAQPPTNDDQQQQNDRNDDDNDQQELRNTDDSKYASSQKPQQQEDTSTTTTTNNNNSQTKKRPRRITLLGLDDILQLEKSGIVGLGGSSSSYNNNANNNNNPASSDDNNAYRHHPDRLNYQELHSQGDMIEDGFYDPFAPDPSCLNDDNDDDSVDDDGGETKNNIVGVNCWHPPDSTVETEYIQVWDDDDDDSNEESNGAAAAAAGLETLAWGYGGDDPDDSLVGEEEDEGEDDVVEQQEKQLDDNNKNNNNQECTTNDDQVVERSGGDDEEDDGKKRANDNKQSSSTASPSSSCEATSDATAAAATATQEKDKQSASSKQSSSSSSKQSSKKKGKKSKTILVDKHWGSDDNILKMRDRLRGSTNRHTNNNNNNNNNIRPPVFLLPGLASTRLVSWKHKPCPQSPLLSDIKMLDHVWLNMNLLIQMATIDVRCWSECMTLGRYQSDYDDDESSDDNDVGGGDGTNATVATGNDGDEDKQDDDDEDTTTSSSSSVPSHGCKLRPDEGLDSISSLAPGSISSNLLVGGTNTVYAWLIQWLADNLGYDVTSIVALPYDWRLSPDKMESRDGFLTLMRKKIEAAVESNGLPGIMVAHSMGNSVFRYFLEWLRVQMQNEAYARYVQQAEHAIATAAVSSHHRGPFWRGRALYRNIMNLPGVSGGRDNHTADDDDIFVEFTRAFESDTADTTSKTNQSRENRLKDGEDETKTSGDASIRKYPKLWELAKMEGDSQWIDWLGKHVWTYVGLAAPLLGAPGPLRSVLSGENMGLPFTDEEARILELSFGSTSSVNPIPTKMGFCDDPDDREEDSRRARRNKSKSRKDQNRNNLACLDELVSGIEARANETYNPWQDYPALRLLLKDRVDYDTGFPMIRVEREYCDENEKSPCGNQTMVDFSALDVMNGNIFDQFSKIWREEKDPLGVKLEQLRDSWWKGNVPNMLESTPDRPHIKHVIMAYGTDVPTEAGYIYRKIDRKKKKPNSNNNSTSSPDTTKEKKLFDGVPEMHKVIWEEKHGRIIEESMMPEPSSFTESILFKKKQTRRPYNNGNSSLWLHHSGDGTIPYLSLMWAHTWLLHATRAMRSTNHTMPMLEGERISNPNNALDSIKVSHRPKGGNDWIQGYGADPRVDENYDYSSRSNIGDTGTSHPHGTKYKPKMVRFQSEGKSRSTGMEYTTTVIEAIGVEHKETTRNYDILAAAFTDVLKNLHEDYGLV